MPSARKSYESPLFKLSGLFKITSKFSGFLSNTNRRFPNQNFAGPPYTREISFITSSIPAIQSKTQIILKF